MGQRTLGTKNTLAKLRGGNTGSGERCVSQSRSGAIHGSSQINI